MQLILPYLFSVIGSGEIDVTGSGGAGFIGSNDVAVTRFRFTRHSEWGRRKGCMIYELKSCIAILKNCNDDRKDDVTVKKLCASSKT